MLNITDNKGINILEINSDLNTKIKLIYKTQRKPSKTILKIISKINLKKELTLEEKNFIIKSHI